MENNNLLSITVKDFCEIIREQFQEGNYRPIFGLGKGGIGKTESIHDLAQELGVGYIDIRLLLYSETDLKGIPYPNADHTKTIWLQNNILPTEEKDGKAGILVFDEITSCSRSVRTAAYQLLNERRLGEYVLPDGWLVVCIGNGEDDGGDYEGMEGNFINRCSIYNVQPDIEAWKDWARSHDINSLVIGYVSWKPGDFHSYTPEAEGEMQFASPRSWKAVSDILNKKGFHEDDRITLARILGCLGTTVGQMFISFCKFSKDTVDPYSIIMNGAKPVIDKSEVLYITLSSVVKIVGDAVTKDVEQNNCASNNTLIMVANALNWILGLSKEVAVMGFKDLYSYNKNSMRSIFMSQQFQSVCPLLMQFAADNKEIFR